MPTDNRNRELYPSGGFVKSLSLSGMVETPRLQAKHESAKCEQSEHELESRNSRNLSCPLSARIIRHCPRSSLRRKPESRNSLEVKALDSPIKPGNDGKGKCRSISNRPLLNPSSYRRGWFSLFCLSALASISFRATSRAISSASVTVRPCATKPGLSTEVAR